MKKTVRCGRCVSRTVQRHARPSELGNLSTSKPSSGEGAAWRSTTCSRWTGRSCSGRRRERQSDARAMGLPPEEARQGVGPGGRPLARSGANPVSRPTRRAAAQRQSSSGSSTIGRRCKGSRASLGKQGTQVRRPTWAICSNNDDNASVIMSTCIERDQQVLP